MSILSLVARILLPALLFLNLQNSALGAQKVIKETRCCYANPSFSGMCGITPGKGETCASIMKYLNNPGSMGKTYCMSTDVRGGWKRVPCERRENIKQKNQKRN